MTHLSKFLIIAIISANLVSCSLWTTKSEQAGSGEQNKTQTIVSTGTTIALTPTNSGSQTSSALASKSDEKSNPQEISNTKQNIKSIDEICVGIANTMKNGEYPDFTLLKSCAMRSALEAKDFKYCLDQTEYLGLYRDSKDALNTCARTVMLHAIEGSVKQNGGSYPKSFCENTFSAIKAGGKSMQSELDKEMLDGNIIDECFAEYAILSGSPKICTDDKIWGEPASGGGLENNIWALKDQSLKQNACIWSVHLRNPTVLSSGSACSMLKQVDWWVVDGDGPCGFSERVNSTQVLGKIATYEKIPSVADLEKKLSDIVAQNKEKQTTDTKRSQEMNGYLK